MATFHVWPGHRMELYLQPDQKKEKLIFIMQRTGYQLSANQNRVLMSLSEARVLLTNHRAGWLKPIT